MANKSKQKGTRAETKVVRFLESQGLPAKRKALSGSQDQGDIELVGRRISIEVKAGKQTASPNRSALEEWLRQSKVEGDNSNTLCVLCVLRYNRRIEDADVYIQHENGIKEHLFLDEFCEKYG